MKTLIWLALISLAFFSISFSQTVSGNLSGRILDNQNNPLQDVNVVVTSSNLLGKQGTVSNEVGQFQIFGIPSGTYNIFIDHAGFHSIHIENVRVALGTKVNIGDVCLELLTMDAIEVQANIQEFDLKSASIEQNYSFDQLDGLPLDRNYQSISKLLPQANESYYGDGISIAGATGYENKFYINGVDVTDPNRGGFSTNLPYNFVQDVQILKGGYEAEYRGSLGGLINVVTYSGGEDFKGQLYGYFTNNRFSRTARQGAYPFPQEYTQYDVGGSIGGPLVPSKLWFFVAYNPMIMRETIGVSQLGDFNDWQTAHIFAGKVSWKLNGNNHFQFSLFGDPAQGKIVDTDFGAAAVTYDILNEEVFLYNIEKGSINTTINGTHILNNNTLLESNMSWSHFRDMRKGKSMTSWDEIFTQDDVNKTISGGPMQSWDDKNVQFALAAKLTTVMNKHMFKAGFSFTSLSYKTDTWVRSLSRPADNIYVEQREVRKGTTGQYIFGLFIQDSWSVVDKLELNAGIRWDPQLLKASNGQIAQKFLNQIAPRLGIVYKPGTGNRDIISISYGRFYQMLSTYMQQWYHLENRFFKLTTWDHDPRIDPTDEDTSYTIGSDIQQEYSGMGGQYYDEYTIRYEHQFTRFLNFSIRGVFRTLCQGIEDGLIIDTEKAYFGNPGKLPLEDFPKISREYKALEFTLEHSGYNSFNFLISYVLSKTYGNYTGIYDYYWRDGRANATVQYDLPDFLVNATGLLGNDRTHVFKIFGSYRTELGLTLGSSLSVMSGIPLSEYGGHWIGYPVSFLSQRGTKGRTPTIWDLNIRAVYELNALIEMPVDTRLVTDIFHIGNPRTAVDYDQIHYFAVDNEGNQINPNPAYLQPVQFQPPLSVRLGLELTF